MARERDLPASRNRGADSATTWVLAMLGLGVLAALLVIAVVPTGSDTDNPTSAEQVVPNTPPPVRTE
ncbi:MAG: hypothetical protein K8F92_09480 [Hyphomicrobium sp.]|uniref:hypothetical protein n=1 Tax=Hyphomicrobium sp. TaxID=82 RepID=UPI0013262800|nr:hypothetical protein [Hyphomicrobium sp.]KAB2939938.1 MAG: hypothetical protein F9K20_14860 [Hyphomicrobium sp.]MBZ0209868.1 hypothetical protein [Hyphomicrobium sp.]